MCLVALLRLYCREALNTAYMHSRQGRLVNWGTDCCAGSMGVGSFVTVGKGDPMSWNSCSHGAGRAMSRTKAKATILQVSSVTSGMIAPDQR